MSPYNAYTQQAATTASPAQLVLMLYDGALARIEGARFALDEDARDLDAANASLGKAQAIIRELQLTLDHERGGQVATSLASLYAYCQELLIRANVEKATPALDEATSVLQPLRDTWEQACVHNVAVAG